jgi:hypothetical protein
MVELAERWRPCRSLAVSYLFASELRRLGPGPATPREGRTPGPPVVANLVEAAVLAVACEPD